MSKNRREKRKLARLSKNPNYIKPYNHKVRLNNEKIRQERKKDRFLEYKLAFLLILTTVVLWMIFH